MIALLQWAIVQAMLDPVRGSEQSGLRPVLIVSNEQFNQAIQRFTVLPLTSARRALYPSEILLPTGTAGLTRDSIVMAHQIRTISKERLRRQLGYLADETLRESIRDAIREHLDLL